MLEFDPLPQNNRRDVPSPGYSYVDVAKIRALVLPKLNATTHTARGETPIFRSVGDYCNRVEEVYKFKMHFILHRPDTFWSDYTIGKLALYLGVEPDFIKISPPLFTLRRAQERPAARAQDFIHDLFQRLVGEELKGKRLTCREYNQWLGDILDASARTIYNLRNGTANPSQMLVERIARHFNLPASEFYRI